MRPFKFRANINLDTSRNIQSKIRVTRKRGTNVNKNFSRGNIFIKWLDYSFRTSFDNLCTVQYRSNVHMHLLTKATVKEVARSLIQKHQDKRISLALTREMCHRLDISREGFDKRDTHVCESIHGKHFFQ